MSIDFKQVTNTSWFKTVHVIHPLYICENRKRNITRFVITCIRVFLFSIYYSFLSWSMIIIGHYFMNDWKKLSLVQNGSGRPAGRVAWLLLVPADARLCLTLFCLVARIGPRGTGQVLWAGATRATAAHAALPGLVVTRECHSRQEEEAQTRPCRRR